VPEGDTLHRTATTLRKVLAGRHVDEVVVAHPRGTPRERTHPGGDVDTVESVGKNLLIRFTDGRVLHTHLKMRGTWHVYRRGERWQRSPRGARVVLPTSDHVAVCFGAPDVRFGRAADIERAARLPGLGPDLLDPDFDRDEALRRLCSLADVPLGEAVMRQHAVAGIGNVYKSEVLFLCGLDPFATVASFTLEQIGDVLDTARRLMHDNLEGYPRVTNRDGPDAITWVYRRSGKPCQRCGTLVRMRRQGDHGRSTYFCASCQNVGT
jgi:endonuclease-8